MSTENSLLTNKEKTICESLGSQRTREGKRAKALLALNDGDTQVIAAKKSGLSYGQIKYLLTVFRKKGMMLFSEISPEKKEPVKVKKDKPKKSKSKAKKKESKKSDKKKDKKSKKDKEKPKAKKNKSRGSKKKKDSKKADKKKKKKSKKKK